MITDEYADKLYAEIYQKSLEITRLRAEIERLRDALMLCRTELRTAAGYRGYEGGPLDHPSVDLALREGDDALKGDSE